MPRDRGENEIERDHENNLHQVIAHPTILRRKSIDE